VRGIVVPVDQELDGEGEHDQQHGSQPREQTEQDQAGSGELHGGPEIGCDLRRQDRQLVFLAEQPDRLFDIVGLERA